MTANRNPGPEAPSSSIPPELWTRVSAKLRLSPRQDRLLELLLSGMQNKEIAAAMNLAEPTLKTYLNRLFRRLGVRDRMQLAVKVFGVALSLCYWPTEGCHPDGCHPK